MERRYDIYLDYKGYMCVPRSYRVTPAPLFGTRFSTGRLAYSGLDFWQTSAMTDFTKGMGQKFFVDPSSYALSLGIDPSQPGEIKLERDLTALTDYTTGTALFTKGSVDVVGIDSAWDQSMVGRKIKNNTNGVWYEIDSVQDALHLKLTEAYVGDTTASEAYTIQFYPTGMGAVTASYRSRTRFFLGTATGKILGSADGLAFTDESAPGTGKIYNFFELAGYVWATRGAGALLVKISDTWYELVEYTTGNAKFTKDSVDVAGTDTEWDISMVGRKIKNDTNGIWYIVASVSSTTALKLTEIYAGDTTPSEAYTIAGITGLYFVMVESDYGFGYFSDGIRRSSDGFLWVPEPPDPLWQMPQSEGPPLNAMAIPRGFFIGSERGVWMFMGGASGINIHTFPDYASINNFKGLDKWGSFAIFSVENLGIFYSEGSIIYPTNINRLNESFPFTSCRGLTVAGYDVYTLVKNASDWYLARANLNYYPAPKYFWLVKKLTKNPCYISSYKAKVFIHYEDGTCEYVDSTKFQSSGYLETSIIDEDLVRLQKFYRSLSAVSEPLPPYCLFKLSCFLNDAWSSTKTFNTPAIGQGVYTLPNPSLDNKIKLKIELESTEFTLTPVITDLCWTYFLETPSGEERAKKMFYFGVLAEVKLEKRDREVTEKTTVRTPEQIISDLWASKQKKEILNFIGADNVERPGMEVEYTGAGASCEMTIDRTNYQIKIYVDDALDQTISYEGKTLAQLVTIIDNLGDYSAELQAQALGVDNAEDLMPIKEQEIKGAEVFLLGNDVRAVIWSQQSPTQMRLTLTELTSARLNISLREA